MNSIHTYAKKTQECIKIIWLFMIIAFSFQAKAQENAGKEVGVYYSNWFSFPTAWTNSGGCVWAEPALGWYESADPAVIDQHTEWLTSAGVDFVIFDWSNNCGTEDRDRSKNGHLWAIEDNSMAFVNRQIWRKRNGLPYLKYCVFLGGCGIDENFTNGFFTAKGNQVRDYYLNDPAKNELYYRLHGQPFLGIWGPEHLTPYVSHPNFYCQKIGAGLGGHNSQYNRRDYWSWEEYTNPGYSVYNGKPECMTIQAGLRGTGGINKPGWLNDGQYGFGNVTVPRNNGQTFRDQLDKAIAADVRIIIVQSFNEWTGCQHNPGEEMNQERSNDIEPMKGGHGDLYIRILREKVAEFKGINQPQANDFLFDSRVFNVTYYYNKYPDLQTAFGYNEAALRNHWQKNGAKEGRQAHPDFWSKTYINRYADLKNAFGSDYIAGIQHYITNGIKEGRSGAPDTYVCAGSACQSSVDYGGSPDRAIDGKTNGVYSNNSVTHTKKEANPWWTWDRGKTANIAQVKIYNRSDCCGNRLSDYYLFVSDKPFSSTDLATTINDPNVWKVHKTTQAGSPTTITVNRPGRYIRVQVNGTQILSLAEVQVIEQTTDCGVNLQPGVYEIIARHSSKAIDVPGFSKENGVKLQQWDAHGGPNQQWRFECLNNGHWKITSVNSGKVLEVSGFGTKNGDKIQQWDWHGGNNQQWKITSVGAGNYKITSRHSGLVLDVAGVSKNNGATIHQWNYVGQSNQQWLLKWVSPKPTEQPEMVQVPEELLYTYEESSIPTGITETSNAMDLNVYPNPVSGQLFIESNTQTLNLDQTKLFDLAGREIQVPVQIVSLVKLGMDLNNIQPGVYLLVVNGQVKKITKQ